MSEARDDWRKRVLFAHLEEPPFCFVEPDGAVKGCDVELAQMVCDHIGVADFTTTIVDFKALMPGLIDEEFHMATGFFTTPERQRLVTFSRPIWALADGLLVRRADVGALRSLDAIAAAHDTRLAVVADQVQEATALKAGVAPDQIRRYASQAEASSAVARSEVDAYLTVAAAHRAYLGRNGGAGLAVLELDGAEAPIGGFGFPRRNFGLSEKVDIALADILGSPGHRRMMRGYGFSDADIDRTASVQVSRRAPPPSGPS